jgi:DNA-binding IclR family transcriptional regulator
MTELSRTLQQLLNRAVVSLPAWHVLEGLAAGPRSGLSLPALVTATGLDVTQAQRAIAALKQLGLVRATPRGLVSLAPRHAGAVFQLVETVAADRTLLIAVIKQAARREFTAEPLQLTVGRRASARAARR